MQEAPSPERAGIYLLKPIPESTVFRGLDRERVALLCSWHGPQRRAERNSQLVSGYETAAPLITLSHGWAFRYILLPDGRRQILSVALPGDTIGLGSVLLETPSYPVQAAVEVVYSTIGHERTKELLAQTDWFRQCALAIVARERAEAELTLTRLGQCSAAERVASVLLEFYDRLAKRGLAAKESFRLDLTREQLADFVGLTQVHLNRILSQLRSRGLLMMVGPQVMLTDIAGLERLGVIPRTA